MDCSTGAIYPSLADALMKGAKKENLKEVEEKNLSIIQKERLEKYGEAMVSLRGRCPCGSGNRFKRCCWTGKVTP